MRFTPIHRHFTCYLCEEECLNSKKGAHLGSTTIRSMANEICTDCVHKNYCWATPKDLQHITTTFLNKEVKSRGLIPWRHLQK